MGIYRIHNTYTDNYFEYMRYITEVQRQSIVDFGTAMINKRKHKRKKK